MDKSMCNASDPTTTYTLTQLEARAMTMTDATNKGQKQKNYNSPRYFTAQVDKIIDTWVDGWIGR